MSRVVMHKASDGSLHETKDGYLEHEEKLNIKRALETVLLHLEHFSKVPGSTEQAIFMSDIDAFIIDNAYVLRNILNNAVVPKRIRKTTEQ